MYILNVTFAFTRRTTKRTNTLHTNKRSAGNKNPQIAKERFEDRGGENDRVKGVREHTGTIVQLFK